MSRNFAFWLIVVLTVCGAALIAPHAMAQTYSLPADNSGCPSNCRVIPWQAGSDLWNGGSLPDYNQVTCSPLNEDGKTDDTSNINSCINAASAGTAVYLPAGTIYVNGTVRLKSNVVLRGAGPNTQINLGSGGTLTTQNFSYSNSNNINPPVSYGSNVSGFPLSGAPKKGDTTVTAASGATLPKAGDYIALFADDDGSLVNANGTDGNCQWCGDNTGHHLMQQIDGVASVSGSTITLTRPLYYTLYTHPQYRIYHFPTQKAGYEYFHVTATGDIGPGRIILLQGCLFCWVKGVETQNTGSSSGSAHIEMDFSYGNEIRDSYVHEGRSSASGANYGIYFQFINSDHKVENNISRHNRHGIIWQGGGSGIAVLYNYLDDQYTDDLSYLGSARTSHGAHPYMNLLEGNVMSHLTADDYWGTSSHFVMFRNWFWGDETGLGVPSFPPSGGYAAVDLYTGQEYYSFVGNVLGRSGLHATWLSASLSGNDPYADALSPIVYSYAGSLSGTASSSATVLRHGNWDYKTKGVAYWDGGSNHTLATSLYYTNQPSFLSGYAWPLEGPEGGPTANANPAEACFQKGPATGGKFDPASCYGSSSGGGNPPPTAPDPPTNLSATAQ